MIQAQNLLLAIFSFIGFCGFFIALYYSLKNNKLTKFASSLWFVFCIGMVFACLWSLTASFAYLGVDPEMFVSIGNILLACFASFLLASTYMSYAGDVKLM